MESFQYSTQSKNISYLYPGSNPENISYLDPGSRNLSALLIRFNWAMAELGFCILYLTPSTNFGITSATALQLSISSSWLLWLVLCWPAPWLAAIHCVAVAAACLALFSRRFNIFRLIVVPTASVVVTRSCSAARLRASWLFSLPGLLAHFLAASTISAVASANALAADNRRFCRRRSY